MIEELRKAPGLIYICFNLWTSKNLISLNGIIVYYTATTNTLKTFLLGLPQQQGSHLGANIADTVAAIIKDFKIQDKLEYFMLDNTSNNDLYIRRLGERFKFNAKHRRLRCVGHILNLIAREALFGSEVDVLEAELTTRRELLDELTIWRRRGPIGRLHNLVIWIYKSP